jgi:DeoR/GlpR family transcriptional regulator of sugar metabolism
MFGSKQGKAERLEQEVEILAAEGEMSVAELAERVGVPPKTVYSDLVALDNSGVRLQEYKGKISVYREY